MRRAPNVWDRFYHSQKTPWRGEQDLSWVLPHLPASGRVLELGCGNGKTLRPLKAAGYDAVGLDISFHAARVAGGLLADAAQLPFPDGTFDAVLDLHCTGHLPAPQRAEALKEAHRVLKANGTIVQERLGPEDLRASRGEDVDGGRRLQDERMTWFLSPDGLREELTTAGFRVVEVGERRRTPRHRDRVVLRQQLRVVAER